MKEEAAEMKLNRRVDRQKPHPPPWSFPHMQISDLPLTPRHITLTLHLMPGGWSCALAPAMTPNTVTGLQYS